MHPGHRSDLRKSFYSPRTKGRSLLYASVSISLTNEITDIQIGRVWQVDVQRQLVPKTFPTTANHIGIEVVHQIGSKDIRVNGIVHATAVHRLIE